jgi:hypothetical protein
MLQKGASEGLESGQPSATTTKSPLELVKHNNNNNNNYYYYKTDIKDVNWVLAKEAMQPTAQYISTTQLHTT